MMSKDSAFTLPVILAAARTETSLGGTDWGMLQAGVTISIIPCVARLPAAAEVLRVRPAQRGGQVTRESDARRRGARRPDRRAAARASSGPSAGRHRPARARSGAAQVRLDGGFWGDRQAINRARTIPHGFDQLQATGHARQPAAGGRGDTARTRPSATRPGAAFPFLDTDVYKWLEAVGWELGRGPDPALEADGRRGDRARRGGAAARRLPQQLRPGRRRRGAVPRPAWGHELYCIGHLIQAAVAWHRRARRRPAARRSLGARPTRSTARSGPGGRDGHRRPSRDRDGAGRAVAGDRRAALPRRSRTRQIDLRGHGLLGRRAGSGREYWQDHRPVREAPTVAGHAVRQLYLDAGAVDVAVETGDRALLDAVIRALDGHGRDARVPDRRARQPPSRRGVRRPVRAAAGPGVRRDLRRDRQRDARLAAAARDRRGPLRRPDRADHVQRACCPGLSLDGTHFFYVNPLQRRSRRSGDDPRRRRPRAVVPVRLLPAQPDAAARVVGAVPGDGRRRRHPAPPVRHGRASRRRSAAGRVRLAIETDYPWAGPGRRSASWRRRTDRGRCRCACRRVRGAATVAVDRRAGAGRSSGPSASSGVPGGAGDVVVLDLDLRHDRHAVRPAGRRDAGLRRARARPARVLHRDGGPARRRASWRTSSWTRPSVPATEAARRPRRRAWSA